MSRKERQEPEKLEMNMSAMIDVVFQLLVFFMLTLKIVEPEGDFNINMPAVGAPTQPTVDIQLPDLKVRMRANPDGTLANMSFGQTSLGNDQDAFKRLNLEVFKVISQFGEDMAKDVEVEIDADYNLHFRHVINAVGACTGKVTEVGGEEKIVKYVEKIKFAPPKPPGGPAG